MNIIKVLVTAGWVGFFKILSAVDHSFYARPSDNDASAYPLDIILN